jgi:signal transduction histidine kinase
MVEEVVAARGGTLDVSTSPSGGARFVVRLPVPATVAAAV